MNFKEEDWNGYKKIQKYKSLTKFLEVAYKDAIYNKGKTKKKENALNVLIKGLKRSLEAVGEKEKAKGGGSSSIAKKIAKVVALVAVTTIVLVVLTPAVGIIAQEVVEGGSITGDVLGSAAQAAGNGLKSLADPVGLAKKVVKKVITKSKDIPGADR